MKVLQRFLVRFDQLLIKQIHCCLADSVQDLVLLGVGVFVAAMRIDLAFPLFPASLNGLEQLTLQRFHKIQLMFVAFSCRYLRTDDVVDQVRQCPFQPSVQVILVLTARRLV